MRRWVKMTWKHRRTWQGAIRRRNELLDAGADLAGDEEAAVRLWHDDTREPPEGWVWARTNDIARELLATGFVTEISLDHDMGAEAGDIYAAGADEDDGTRLVWWMIDNHLVPPVVTIHSWNTVGAERMAHALVEAGHDVTLAPYVVPGLTVRLRAKGGEHR